MKRISGPTLRNTAHHQENQMAAELNTNLERMKDEVLSGVHALVEGQAEAPPVEAVEGELATMNATTEVNTQLLQLIQDPQQQVSSLATTNNRTNQGNNNGPPNPPNPRNPSNSPNL